MLVYGGSKICSRSGVGEGAGFFAILSECCRCLQMVRATDHSLRRSNPLLIHFLVPYQPRLFLALTELCTTCLGVQVLVPVSISHGQRQDSTTAPTSW
jgi:hypothetical protein